jgi:hypothetical protein
MTDNTSHSSLSHVNDEVVVGQDENFEQRWWKFEMASWAVIIVILVITALGGLGRGLLSHAKTETPDGTLEVDYERMVHFRTPAEVTVNIRQGGFQNGAARLLLNQTFYKELGLERITPRPAVQAGTADGEMLIFPVAPNSHELKLHLMLQPGTVTVSNQQIGFPGGQSVHFRQLVLP